MGNLTQKVLRNKKKVFFFTLAFLLALSLPVTTYFITSDDSSFDDRGEAANNLVKEYRPKPGKPISKPQPGTKPDTGKPLASCSSDSDCRNEAPYEICSAGRTRLGNVCLRGDIDNDGQIGLSDFVAFKEDFISYYENGWSEDLIRSDLNIDTRLSMADYGMLVRSYRLVKGLDGTPTPPTPPTQPEPPTPPTQPEPPTPPTPPTQPEPPTPPTPPTQPEPEPED